MNYLTAIFYPSPRSYSFQSDIDPYSPASSRRSTGFSSTSSSSTYRRIYGEEQMIEGRYIDRRKLQELLKDRFGHQYRLQMRSNNYRLYAGRRLSEEEILSCC
ncbi:hypothetical protein CPAR01_01600 [Colletotrichum paranaense]|uniref:Uncharacterized protein n=3 Tax=Colletotrichum acutatum species complex TaxID=2707335 RepID=A0AAI9UAR5_9PEZI|nr:uncharacterized protein CPAR01_01600 [Colletotrichum paranaense]XP_060375008.1 uncharacterized protein CTAM01_14439 [Colletotrichum tamarilloi]KAK1454902.1 hypothetical protein CMEL01_03662 [Colletotrichum melonis]KAK1480392.1 hypothetical protein CTAM01_14439 [Colletotrichum tamarilloi]KAK1547633.1 hypothetical protein CPAR01_01600 [Colletotrichum paranaense]